MGKYVLPEKIIRFSKANTWHRAKQEWETNNIYRTRDFENVCLCGHPIKEVLVIKNKLNGKKLIVGNCCINKLNGVCANKLFAAIKRVENDNTKNYNADIIKFVYNKGIIQYKDYNFYMSIWRKRNLSIRQENWRKDIHKKILNSKIINN
jgi:hypothetical protein